VNIYRLENGQLELVESIQQSGLAIGSYQIFWKALWPIGNDLGRHAGLYRVIVSAVEVTGGATSDFTIGTLLQITSVDMHNVSASPSFDGSGNPAFPFIIRYDLAKNSRVTVAIFDSNGTLVRLLLDDFPQADESVRTNSLTWNGLGDNNRPVSLGVYTVAMAAYDELTGDTSIVRTRTMAVNSLASLDADANKLFDTNTYVYPNPVRNGSATFNILPVRPGARISLMIYTIAGDLVRKESFSNLAVGTPITFTWDAANQSGKKLGRGLYYYVVREEDDNGTLQTVKKFAVIP